MAFGPRRQSRWFRPWLAVAGRLGAWLLRLLAVTWRVRVQGADPFRDGPCLAALWHRGFLAAACVWRDRGISVPVSRSRDGDLLEAVLRRLGYGESPRGSSSEGGSRLLRGLIRCVRDQRSVAVLPDGPRGPARRLKPGVLAVARASGRPVVPVALSARPCLRLGTWDRALVPLPFARVRCAYGSPVVVPKRAGEGELDELRRALERELDALTDRVDAELGLPVRDLAEVHRPAEAKRS